MSLSPTTEVGRRLEETSFVNLREIVARCEARGVRSAFASFAAVRPDQLRRPEREYVDYTIKVDWNGEVVGLSAYRRWIDLYNLRLREFCQRHGVLCLPLAEEMPGEMAWFQDLCHMTDEGIERKAEILARLLETEVRAGREGQRARR